MARAQLISRTKWISKEKDQSHPHPPFIAGHRHGELALPGDSRAVTAHTMGGRHLGAMYHWLGELFKDCAMKQRFELMGQPFAPDLACAWRAEEACQCFD